MTTFLPDSPDGGGSPCFTGVNVADGNFFQIAQAAPKPSRHSA